jgi:hypothetical protein
MTLGATRQRVAADRAAAPERRRDELKSDVSPAAAVSLRTDERRSTPARVQRIVRGGALSRSSHSAVLVCRELEAKIAKVDDVVDAAFLHADSAAPIGSAAAGRLHRMVWTESVELAAGVARWLTANFTARVESAAGWSVDIDIRHTLIVAGAFAISARVEQP